MPRRVSKMISLLLLPRAPQFQCWRHKRHSTGWPWQEQHRWSQPWNWGHGAREWKAWWQQVQVEARDTLDHLFSLKCCLNNTVYRLKMRLMMRRQRLLRFMAASHFRASRRWALFFRLRLHKAKGGHFQEGGRWTLSDELTLGCSG